MVLSLSRARKANEKAKNKMQAKVNISKFGQTKAAKNLTKAQAEKASRLLDGHARGK